jgi:plastocyanin
VLTAATAVVVLAGSMGVEEPTEPAATVQIVATGAEQPFAFEPDELTVAAGTTVRWHNTTDEVFHTVTFTDSLSQRQDNGMFNASLFAAGDVVEFTFDEEGTYLYFCQPHSEFMVGTIVVTAHQQGSTAWRWWAGAAAGVIVVVAVVVITKRRSRRTVADR